MSSTFQRDETASVSRVDEIEMLHDLTAHRTHSRLVGEFGWLVDAPTNPEDPYIGLLVPTLIRAEPWTILKTPIRDVPGELTVSSSKSSTPIPSPRGHQFILEGGQLNSSLPNWSTRLAWCLPADCELHPWPLDIFSRRRPLTSNSSSKHDAVEIRPPADARSSAQSDHLCPITLDDTHPQRRQQARPARQPSHRRDQANPQTRRLDRTPWRHSFQSPSRRGAWWKVLA
jgi:hypothetical protein